MRQRFTDRMKGAIGRRIENILVKEREGRLKGPCDAAAKVAGLAAVFNVPNLVLLFGVSKPETIPGYNAMMTVAPESFSKGAEIAVYSGLICSTLLSAYAGYHILKSKVPAKIDRKIQNFFAGRLIYSRRNRDISYDEKLTKFSKTKFARKMLKTVRSRFENPNFTQEVGPDTYLVEMKGGCSARVHDGKINDYLNRSQTEQVLKLVITAKKIEAARNAPDYGLIKPLAGAAN